MKFLKGVVSSRRLGRSLGINLLPDLICSEDCIYCECGATRNLTLERKEYVPTDQVISELDRFMEKEPVADYITFSGLGEPTLHSGIGKIIDYLKNNYPEYKVALLTNSSLLHEADIRNEIKNLDLIVPSLDAGTEKTFKKICRPAKGLTLNLILEGIKAISDEFNGEIRLEILFLKGVNDSDREVNAIIDQIKDFRIDQVDINTLDRAPAVAGFEAVSKKRLTQISKKIPFKTEIFI
ncbi:MAG: radical SAM protein [Halarsenatibacteraceae bacterium]